MIAGRYELERKVGRGGMGSVWLGRDVVLGRAVALKKIGVMPDGSSPDLLRAEREARIAASVNHPNVVGVFDLVTDDDEQWLVMEYVEGTTLAGFVRDRPASATDGAVREQGIDLLAQIAGALAAAHAAGIVHRDVKPSNMLVRTDGRAKLSDFGIARGERDASLTRTGLVTGSPAYLAPEVASGRQASAASDVWGFGATAFFVATGHPPYDMSGDVLGALYRIVHEPPPRLPDGADPRLATVVEHTLIADPSQRWSMVQVAESLGADELPHPVPLVPTSVPGPAEAPPGQATSIAPLADATTYDASGSAATDAPADAPANGWSDRAFAEPSDERPDRDRRRGGALLPVLLATAGVALIVVLAVLLLRSGSSAPNGSAGPDPSAGGSSGSSSSSAPTQSDSTGSPSSSKSPTAVDMRAFVSSYLDLADRNPNAAFRQLTSSFQQASGGRSGYLGFWSRVSDHQLLGQVRADPSARTVTYRYRYRYAEGGGRSRVRTDRVTLQLQFDPTTGSYLIAGTPNGNG